MAVNAFLTFFDKASGESTLKGKEKWIEVLGWDWDVEAESSWIKGGGASVGKPQPGSLRFEHRFDTASTVLLAFICSGRTFPKAELQVVRASARAPETFFTMTMEDVLITKIANSGGDEGNVNQRVLMVFRTVKIDYRPQDATGKLGPSSTFTWDIPAGKVSP